MERPHDVSPALHRGGRRSRRRLLQRTDLRHPPLPGRRQQFFCFDWAWDNIDRYGTPTVQHLKLVVLAAVFGFLIAFALALLAHRRRWLQPPLLAATGVLYTIPSVAFFFLLLPFTGRGVDTAVIALTAFNLQIIYRNTIVGLANVPGIRQRRGPRDGPDRPPGPLAGRAAAGDAGDHRRPADRDREHGRDRDARRSSPAAAGSASRSSPTGSTSRPTSSSPAGSRS